MRGGASLELAKRLASPLAFRVKAAPRKCVHVDPISRLIWKDLSSRSERATASGDATRLTLAKTAVDQGPMPRLVCRPQNVAEQRIAGFADWPRWAAPPLECSLGRPVKAINWRAL